MIYYAIYIKKISSEFINTNGSYEIISKEYLCTKALKVMFLYDLFCPSVTLCLCKSFLLYIQDKVLAYIYMNILKCIGKFFFCFRN